MQRGYIASWDQDGFPTATAAVCEPSYNDKDSDSVIGQILAFREVTIVRVADYKVKGSVASTWVLVVDADSMLSLGCSEYEPEKDWLCESKEETAVGNPAEASNGGRGIAVEHYENRAPSWSTTNNKQ